LRCEEAIAAIEKQVAMPASSQHKAAPTKARTIAVIEKQVAMPASSQHKAAPTTV
jgi:hypothetical protein